MAFSTVYPGQHPQQLTAGDQLRTQQTHQNNEQRVEVAAQHRLQAGYSHTPTGSLTATASDYNT